MKIVIQCAASKQPKAGYFRATNGEAIKFVAHPQYAASSEPCAFAKPDDLAESHGKTWRDLVADYNESEKDPFGLYPAYRLYSNPTYGALIDRFGVKNVYILSAGWGLIRSNFLTPQYDITFSTSAESFKRRRKHDAYADFCHLTDDGVNQVVFFGGKDYLPLFLRLTAAVRGERIIFFNSQIPPNAPGCCVVKYETTMRTNWHYACAKDLLVGRIALP